MTASVETKQPFETLLSLVASEIKRHASATGIISILWQEIAWIVLISTEPRIIRLWKRGQLSFVRDSSSFDVVDIVSRKNLAHID